MDKTFEISGFFDSDNPCLAGSIRYEIERILEKYQYENKARNWVITVKEFKKEKPVNPIKKDEDINTNPYK